MTRTSDDITANGPFKYFKHHIDYLNKFKNWTSFEVKSEIPTLDKVKLQLKKGEKSFFYRVNNISTPVNELPVKYQNVSYGFKKPFTIFNKDIELCIPDGVDIYNHTFTETNPYFGSITKLNTKNLFSGRNFYRSIIPFDYKDYNDITVYFETNPVKIDNWSKFTGLLNTDGFDIFEYTFEQIPYLIIETKGLITFEEFNQNLEKVVYCFALISGNLYRDENYLFSSNEKSFQNIKGFGFRCQGRTIIGNLTVIPYRFLNAINKSKEYDESRITSKYLNKIINKTIKEPELYRCIKLLTEAADLALELRTSIYSVCLETIRNIIQDKNKDKLKPFKEVSDCDKFKEQSKRILLQFPENSFINKEAIIKRIDNINQIGNTESFQAIFDLLTIILTEDDIACIKKRNDFLHGRVPFDKVDELQYISDKLYQLVEYLILKYCGYAGIVLSQANLKILLKGKKLIKDPYILRQL